MIFFVLVLIFISGDSRRLKVRKTRPFSHYTWEKHKMIHGLEFDSQKDPIRRRIFEENSQYIRDFNSKGRSFTLGHNRFSHMTHEEYLEFLMRHKEKKLANGVTSTGSRNLSYKLKGIDWRKRGAVTHVKNQAHCGSCWAFGSTESVESAYFIKYNKTVILSPQNLVDCSWEYGNRGCGGGLHNWAFKFMIDNGINQESDYPYEARDGKCRMRKDAFLVKLSGHEEIPMADEDKLAQVLEERGPISVSIDAGQKDFRFYMSGIYYNPDCSQIILNHDVSLVGMDLLPVPNYIVRNSWTYLWGDQGFIRFPWNGTNPCGIASDAMIPII